MSARRAADKGLSSFSFLRCGRLCLVATRAELEAARGDGDVGGFEQSAHVVSRRRNSMVGGPAADD